ncbi:translational GTPase TypA [Corynebacterium pseudodiphtheriticum]|uniref:Large ribosomal subunit assembly factor BipA n=2 Tax=Corynebacterium TaxID=1716 RepID=A0AAP4BT31_9CORY|nr:MULTISPECIES: translational GTPase TypA [Corynebacterium]ERJ45174.1 GTP-binding protein TypA [Corynebacterium pseudodiphtheriticum 090104]ERS38771.1 GTP-binding protein TypA/BipA [Corynebacterium sp. KPL1995]ERS71149.1 GTP-binding protein TypA/BipA [Corynebacterium sp. KPL1989]MCG7253043.1 translational GTPase TypA [Corynebacterium pseudodiphtheriticum]MCT1634246.1 translational GTPase TypA [Corynebacterium pseudodiphtheriticum]
MNTEFRNVAIVAHVDHGKTTLVNGMLEQSGAFGEHGEVNDRVMDSNDQEKERGITILAKNTAVRRKGLGKDGADLIINVIDTPGHADFGGEVERGISMVDGVVLLVDAAEGPLPQTRFVLTKALEAKLPVIIAVNKTDRPDARIDAVVQESQDLLLEIAAGLENEEAAAAAEELLDLPVLYASGREGKASTENPGDGNVPDSEDLQPLFDVIYDVLPEPSATVDAPLQAHVTNLDSSDFLGRLALLRVYAGKITKGQQVAWIHYDEDGNEKTTNVKVAELLRTEGFDRKPAQEAIAGDIVAISGIPEIMIGDTVADPESPKALPRIAVDEPAISMTIGVNTSPLAGRGGGDKMTARLLKNRLDQELIGNVSLRVLPTEKPDAWEVQGRGEMALSVLIESMRREGFELTVGKPEVVTQTINGQVHEPYEIVTIDVPGEFQGNVTQLLAGRKGQMQSMDIKEGDWVRMVFRIPARGLIGFRTQFMTETRGTGIANSMSDGMDVWAGQIKSRATGSLVADRSGKITQFALMSLADRGNFFVEPGAEAYEGMVVGANNRDEDMDINITKEKKLTNMRAASADTTVTLAKAKTLSLEEALEFCGNDECVEVAPEVLRVRKVELNASERRRAASRAKNQK